MNSNSSEEVLTSFFIFPGNASLAPPLGFGAPDLPVDSPAGPIHRTPRYRQRWPSLEGGAGGGRVAALLAPYRGARDGGVG